MKLRKIIALCAAVALLLSSMAIVASASANQPTFTIGNPYANVDWDSFGQYKTQLHVHSSASDGEYTIRELVELHYELGYDILAITDHATVGVPWDQAPRIVPYLRLLQVLGIIGINNPRDVLTSERRQEILDGIGRDGRGMLEITGGIEHKGVAILAESHVNSFWAGDYGQGMIGINGDFRTPIAEVHRRGGISFINHPGRITGAQDMTAAQAQEFYALDSFWASRFAALFLDFDSLVGVEVIGKDDRETHNDRILYDTLLQLLIPHGVTPWLFTNSDGHRTGEFDRAFTVHLLEEKTEANLRHSMENGEFFSVARYAWPEFGDRYGRRDGNHPQVSRISVNETTYTITIEADYYDNVVWVSNGVEIATGTTLNLANYSDEIGVYVRAYLTGPGGILYVQPFTVLRAGQTWEELQQPIVEPRAFADTLRTTVDVFEFVFGWFPPTRWLTYLVTQFDFVQSLPWLHNLFN